MAGKLAELSNDTFDSSIKDGVTLVDFWAPWCGPCRMMTPILEKLSTEFTDKADIVKCNVEDNNALAAKYGVSNIPTLIIFKDGEEVTRQSGVVKGDKLTEMLNQHL